MSRRDLERHGFAGEVGQSVVIPRRDGATVIAVGVGERPSSGDLRNAAAVAVRNAQRHQDVALDLLSAGSSNSADARRRHRRRCSPHIGIRASLQNQILSHGLHH